MKQTDGALKRADFASGIGAGALGVGLGALLADELRPIAAIALLLGAMLHGWAMWRKHHLVKQDPSDLPHFSVVLAWVCWLGFAAIAVLIVTRAASSDWL